jgi:FdhD protein
VKSIVKGVGRREVRRVAAGAVQPATEDDVVVEEPLEIRAAGETLAVTMRTPGHDRELAVGFLFAEGVISSRDDVSRVAHCGRPDQEGFGNTIDVAPGPGAEFDVDRVSLTRRGTLTTAACGVCGRRSVQDVIDRCTALSSGPVVAAQDVAAAMDKLRSFQPNFSRTGGIHAAAVLDRDLKPLAAFEDIGRHNALDKVVGSLVLAGKVPGAEAVVLLVSGRASFEVVQKAAMARIKIVASVSAASSLAIDLANATGMTLCGFVRGGGMTVYAHPERLH